MKKPSPFDKKQEHNLCIYFLNRIKPNSSLSA